ncbi:MAG: hypothetical protein LKJ99_06710 [Acidaminococcaceae bacterium]|jgi:guanyl-specific ribonuclease Sa|nr:hypothetical protein [Acidaminococcaceae bacterium]MCI2110643.1 hypothetical protein [Acidaminococcaceae bacterium]
MKKVLSVLTGLLLVAIFIISGCGSKSSTKQPAVKATNNAVIKVEKNGSYTSKQQVALYIHEYHKLPQNYLTKNEARKLGWPKKGTLDKVAPGKSIGGDYFGNAEKKLPIHKGTKYTECDIDYVKGNRGPKRIVFDNNGNIYYCGDHYNTFEKLY